ncbi:hypothetical protein GGS20DRAFT_599346 [Poronia punctata]|nr:hypothetical protein GGS20DRAFT_599346 [Poronia punctata]
MAAAVDTTMNYHLDPAMGGMKNVTFGTVGVLRRKFDNHPIKVTDLRGREADFKIHANAFEVCRWKPSTDSLEDDEIKKIVFPEAEEFIKKVTGATRVHCFSHLIRQSTFEQNLEALKQLEAIRGKDNISDNEGFGKTVPARYAHVDQSGKGARSLLSDHLPEEAEKLTRTRWGTVNLWRPLVRVQRDPLGFCDGRTLSEEDLVPIDTVPPPKGTSSFYEAISRGDGFQTYEIRYNPRHEWYYLSEMEPEEALIFKCYDTKDSSRSRCCHSSFRNPEYPDAPPRESMEMRFFVFYEDQPLE